MNKFLKRYLIAILIIIIFYVIKNNKQKKVENVSFQLESKCKCKINNKINLTKINDSYYKVIIKNKEKVREYFLNANTRVTCDLYNALNRGKNQNILSYSLYGNDSFYFKYLHNLTYLVKKMYPKWSIRIYHDSSRELETIKCEIECKLNENSNDLIDNIDFCDATQLPVSLSNINLSVGYH